METITLPHFRSHPLHVGLFTGVQNAQFLRAQLLRGNSDFEYAFLDASVLISRRHILASCMRALNDLQSARLKTRNVHSEIVFALSPNNNIAESFRRFGLSDDSTNIVAIKVGGDSVAIEDHLRRHVQGDLKTLDNSSLATVQDAARIRKLYRLEAPKKGEPANQLTQDAETFVIGSMALKGS